MLLAVCNMVEDPSSPVWTQDSPFSELGGAQRKANGITSRISI